MSAPFGDYYLAGYTVLCDRAEIHVRAERTVAGDPCVTQIIFSGVAAYHLEHDNFGTILTHIVEHPLESFIQARSGQFDKGWQQSGWPSFWSGSISDALASLRAEAVHAFEITSAYGLQGWVLSRAFKTFAVEAQAA